MRQHRLVALAIGLTLLVPGSALAQRVVPVQFARGMSSSTIDGSIRGREYIDYRIVARAGQRLDIRFRTVAGSPYFNLMEPGSRDVAIYNSSMANPRYSGLTKRSGAYTIRVYQMRATGRRGELARFQLAVSIRNAGANVARPGRPPGDALVPGTPYHATAMVRCVAAQGAPMGQCKAGVTRHGAGTATVHLDTPDGGQRTINFRNGEAVSSDSENRFRATRRGDMSIVRIGAVEVYEIPDALVSGG